MTKNVDLPLNDLEGKPLRDGETPVTIKRIVVNALMSLPNDDKQQQPDGEEKARRFELGMRLNTGGDQDLTPEDISLIKKLVGTMYMPLVVGQIYRWANE